jgi:hypothetical protein
VDRLAYPRVPYQTGGLLARARPGWCRHFGMAVRHSALCSAEVVHGEGGVAMEVGDWESGRQYRRMQGAGDIVGCGIDGAQAC